MVTIKNRQLNENYLVLTINSELISQLGSTEVTHETVYLSYKIAFYNYLVIVSFVSVKAIRQLIQ